MERVLLQLFEAIFELHAGVAQLARSSQRAGYRVARLEARIRKLERRLPN